MKLPRRHDLTPAQFLDEFLSRNVPAIITGGVSDHTMEKWTSCFFLSEFGNSRVQVYDSLFGLQDVVRLQRYIDKHFGRDQPRSEEYVRWYVKFKDEQFAWADDAFARLRSDWCTPSFFPSTGFVLPNVRYPQTTSPTLGTFPYTGLFISAKGCRTRLHRDPLGTGAILFQITGQKSISMFNPQQERYLYDGSDCVDLQAPDRRRYPALDQARPDYSDVLEPGEMLFIPSGWFHDVVTASDSISITWNFVHESYSDAFLACLARGVSSHEFDVLDFFLRPIMQGGGTTDEKIAKITQATVLRRGKSTDDL